MRALGFQDFPLAKVLQNSQSKTPETKFLLPHCTTLPDHVQMQTLTHNEAIFYREAFFTTPSRIFPSGLPQALETAIPKLHGILTDPKTQKYYSISHNHTEGITNYLEIRLGRYTFCLKFQVWKFSI